MGRKLIYSEFVSFVISPLLATSTDPYYSFSFDRYVTNDREWKVSFFPGKGDPSGPPGAPLTWALGLRLLNAMFNSLRLLIWQSSVPRSVGVDQCI